MCSACQAVSVFTSDGSVMDCTSASDAPATVAQIHSRHRCESQTTVHVDETPELAEKVKAMQQQNKEDVETKGAPCFHLKHSLTRKLIGLWVLLIFNCFSCKIHEQR